MAMSIAALIVLFLAAVIPIWGVFHVLRQT
jgi:hypothetical protein